MLPIRWRTEAQADLATILAYIAERNPQAAADLHDRIDHAVSQLPLHPYLYRAGRVANTHEMIIHPSYLIVYRVGTTAIEIISIVHTRQQYP